MCTLSTQCFDPSESDKAVSDSILITDDYTNKLSTAQNVSLNSKSLLFFKFLLDNQSTTETITIKKDDSLASKSRVYNTPVNDHRPTISKYVLTTKDQHDIFGGKELNDQLVSVYLYLLKQNFPQIAGLWNTVLQQQ